MKKYLIIVLAVLGIVFTSCKKEEEPVPVHVEYVDVYTNGYQINNSYIFCVFEFVYKNTEVHFNNYSTRKFITRIPIDEYFTIEYMYLANDDTNEINYNYTSDGIIVTFVKDNKTEAEYKLVSGRPSGEVKKIHIPTTGYKVVD